MVWVNYLLRLHYNLGEDNLYKLECRYCKKLNHYMNKKCISCAELDWKK